MAGQKAVAVLLVTLLVHSMPTAALRKPKASTGADGLQRQAPAELPVVADIAPAATYIIGGGYRATSDRVAEASCGAVGQQPITTFEECRSAAEQVGIEIQEMVGPGTWRHVPDGCSVLQGTATPRSGAVGTTGKVHFSTTPGNNNGRRGGFVLICKNTKVNNRIAVFSAQFGGRDRVQYRKSTATQVEMDTEDVSLNPWSDESYQFREMFEHIPNGIEAFLFTDMVNVQQKGNSPWNFVYPARQFEEFCDDNVLCLRKENPNLTQGQESMQHILQSKFYKTRWIAENTQYDFIVWMDGKYVMRNRNLNETIHSYMGENVDMLVMKHPERNTVGQEVAPASSRAADILHDRSVIQKAKEIYLQYRHEGFSDTSGLFDSAMFIVRPARVRDMFLDWWHQVQLGVPRDQLSLPWMIQKHRINVRSLRQRGACDVLGHPCMNPGHHRS